MRALLLRHTGVLPEYTEHPAPIPGRGETLVHIRAAALNHRDLFITQGLYAGIRLPCILGSDGAGISGGREVVIYPARAWGRELACQGPEFRVLGMPDPGTFAEWIAVPKSTLYPKPAHLSMVEAAALPLAGLTAWRALMTQGKLRSGQKVLITGIGGGVALTAMQLALAAGAEVWVTSGDEAKIERAKGMGASGGANYRHDDWARQLRQAGLFNLIVDSAGGDGFAGLPALAAPGGRIVTYGGTLGKVNGLSPQIIFWKQLHIIGSTMGSPTDFKQMLQFVERFQIKPVVEAVIPMSNGAAAFNLLSAGTQFGKVALDVSR